MAEGKTLTEAELAGLRLEGLEHFNTLRSGAATERDMATFLAWRAQGAAHEGAWRESVRLHRLVCEAETASTPDARAGTSAVPFASVARAWPTRRIVLGGAIAASAVAVVAAGRSLDFIASPAEMAADHRTGAGERSVVRLAGGATIFLNTRTSIELVPASDVPTVDLIRGEAIMTSGAGGYSALIAGQGRSVGRGARFSARREGDEVCVTCLSGRVAVTWRDVTRALAPRQQVRYDERAITPVALADPALVTAWQSGTLIFRSMPMREVIAEINRYRPGRVLLTNQRLAERRLTGTYYINRLDDFFKQAELAFGVRITRLPGGIVLLA